MWPVERLLEEGVDLTLLFYNPNIHPNVEWQRRLENALKVSDHYDVPLMIKGCSLAEEWIKRAEDGQERCRFCYQTRMDCVAQEAAKDGFDAFSTTLLVSPYQDRDLILEEGEKAAKQYGIQFIPYDWRDGYREGQSMAKDIELYRQKYCGCVVSLENSRFTEKISREHEKIALWECLQTGDFAKEVIRYDKETWDGIKKGEKKVKAG